MRKKRFTNRDLAMHSHSTYHGSSTTLAENTCFITEQFCGTASEPMTAIHINAFLAAARDAKLQVGDVVKVEAHHKDGSHKRKLVRCRVFAVEQDLKRTQLITGKKKGVNKVYLLQETGVEKYPLSDADFDQGLQSL